ncbi:hypothetical protein [Microvirga arabica]|uniref:hypothetical protein n=1 Tax=Microvirga arabica TaxID=1128671 RepID=UPI001939F059|nr:hypothetical protein [Microvirga arabica]MBM1169864.1 hypothetical protein [Microvirga arabica]
MSEESSADGFFTNYLAWRSEMLGIGLENTYRSLREMGLVKSQRDFCRFLSRGPGYLKEFRRAGRDMVKVSAVTVETLQSRLCAIKARVPAQIAVELDDILEDIERACRVADVIGRGR